MEGCFIQIGLGGGGVTQGTDLEVLTGASYESSYDLYQITLAPVLYERADCFASRSIMKVGNFTRRQ